MFRNRSTIPPKVFTRLAERFLSTKDNCGSKDDFDPNLDLLLENNKKWAQAKLVEDPHHFDNIRQKPKYLFFGCSNSRVPAYDMLGLRYVVID